MRALAIGYSEKKLLARRTSSQSKWQRITLLSVLGYEGLGGIAGGALLIASPDGRYMDMPVDMMHGTFGDFLIPGIILFGMGVFTVTSFFSVLRRSYNDWFMAWTAIIGWAIWFWIEIAIILELHWLHAMWGLPVILGGVAAVSLLPARDEQLRKAALICGIISSVLYLFVNIIVPTQWPGYDHASRIPSELSAIGAPTRALWTALATPYTFLVIAFGWGVWRSAGDSRKLRLVGILLLAYGGTGFIWPFAPMHLRETLAAGGGTFSDTMHRALGAVTNILYLLSLAIAATAFGKGFRIYSIVTFVVTLVFGALTFMESPGVGTNSPTPTIGIWERIDIGVYLVWVVVLAAMLLPARRGASGITWQR